MDGEKDGKLGTESLRWWTMSDPDLEFQPPNKMTRPPGFCFALLCSLMGPGQDEGKEGPVKCLWMYSKQEFNCKVAMLLALFVC